MINPPLGWIRKSTLLLVHDGLCRGHSALCIYREDRMSIYISFCMNRGLNALSQKKVLRTDWNDISSRSPLFRCFDNLSGPLGQLNLVHVEPARAWGPLVIVLCKLRSFESKKCYGWDTDKAPNLPFRYFDSCSCFGFFYISASISPMNK